jgi:hypothetical protein
MKVLIAVIVTALCLPVAANAHSGSWYWNRHKAEYEVMEYGLEWDNEFDEVYSARCYGFGKWIRMRPGQSSRSFGFKHFRCRISTLDDADDYWIVFHVLDRDGWTFNWLRWADQ